LPETLAPTIDFCIDCNIEARVALLLLVLIPSAENKFEALCSRAESGLLDESEDELLLVDELEELEESNALIKLCKLDSILPMPPP